MMLQSVGLAMVRRIRDALIPEPLSSHVSHGGASFMPRRRRIDTPTVRTVTTKTAAGFCRSVTVWLDGGREHLEGLQYALCVPIDTSTPDTRVCYYVSQRLDISLWAYRRQRNQYALLTEVRACDIDMFTTSTDAVSQQMRDLEEGLF